jgi:hypothetical protein
MFPENAQRPIDEKAPPIVIEVIRKISSGPLKTSAAVLSTLG